MIAPSWHYAEYILHYKEFILLGFSAALTYVVCMKKITVFKATKIAFIRRRLAELSCSIAEAERRCNVPKDTIQKMLQGKGTDYEKYIAVMAVLRYSVPLYGKLISGLGVQMQDMATTEKAHVQLHEGIEYSPELQAIVVDDDRYEPRYFKGTLLYFKATSNNTPSSIVSKHPYVIKQKNHAADVRIVRSGTQEGRYNLLAIDGSAEIIQDAELEWCAPIEGSKWEY